MHSHKTPPGPPPPTDGPPHWGKPAESLLGPWRQLMDSQVAFLRDLWNAGSSAPMDASAWQARASELWARWGTPGAWMARPGARPPAATVTPVLSFTIDGAAEATVEQRLVLPPGREGDWRRPTPLRNLTGDGEIPAVHVELREDQGPLASGGLRVALVDLGSLQRRRQRGELQPGLYVGAIIGGEQGGPLAVVQVQLAG